MSTESFEIAYQWIALKDVVGSAGGGGLTAIVPVEGENFDEAWLDASNLAEEGWELVGAVPITAGAFPPGGSNVSVRDIGFSFTSAFVLLFKRRIE